MMMIVVGDGGGGEVVEEATGRDAVRCGVEVPVVGRWWRGGRGRRRWRVERAAGIIMIIEWCIGWARRCAFE